MRIATKTLLNFSLAAISNRCFSILFAWFAALTVGFGQLNVALDRPTQLYNTGETAQFSITSDSGGPVTYKIGYDNMTAPLATGTLNLAPGVPASVPYSAAQPAGVFLFASQNGQTAVAQAAFSPYRIQPAEAEPTDFDAFWNTQKALVQQVALDPQLTLDRSSARSTTYKMRLDFIDGRGVYGYVTVPNGIGPFPAIVHFPAFGQGAGLVNPLDYLTDELGCISIAISIHNAPVDQADPNAYLPNDPTDRNNIYFRYAVLAGLQTIRYLFTRPDFDGQNLCTTGESQGNGLALMVAGLENRVKLVCGSISAMSEHGGFKYGRASGFPNYLNTASITSGGNQTAINTTLAAVKYYDVQYFAKRYTGASFTAIAYKDEISPAATIFTALNQSAGRETILHSLNLGHSHADEYWAYRSDAIRRFLPPTRTPQNNPFPPVSTGLYADAGTDATATVNQAFGLTGRVEHNLAVNATFPVRWELISGPGLVAFGNPTSRSTSATFSAQGTYVLRFSANDEALLTSKQRYFNTQDFVKITVEGAVPPPPPPPPIPVCAPKGLEPWVQWISNISFANLNRSSGKDGYADRSNGNNVAAVDRGKTYNLSLRPAFSWATFDEFWRVWIDWNNNGTFEETTETVFEGHGTTTRTATVTIPATATTARLKMRIAMKKGAYAAPCEVFQFGEVEDYSVVVSGTPPPPPPPQPCSMTGQISAITCLDKSTPFDSADDRWQFNLTLNAANGSTNGWSGNLNGAAYLGQYGPTITFENQPFAGTLTLTATDRTDANCRFTTTIAPPAPCVQTPPPPPPPVPGEYCEVSASFPWHEWIAAVHVNDQLVMASGKTTYSDFTALEIPLEAGKTVGFQVVGQFSWETNPEYLSIWIDYDHNGVFDTPAERVFSGSKPAPPPAVDVTVSINGDFDVPQTAEPGKTRMRIGYGRAADLQPCGDLGEGEVEDYTVNIVSNARLTGGRAAAPVDLAKTAAKNAFFPVPASSEIWFETSGFEEKDLRLTMTDMAGRPVASAAFGAAARGKFVRLDLSGVQNGVYFLRAEAPGMRKIMRKVVVEKGQ